MDFTVGKNGSFRVPSVLLRHMGIGPGEHVRIAYISRDSELNEYRELLLYGDTDKLPEEQKIMIPSGLLERANISEGDDLQIACLDGCLLIYQDSATSEEELREILEQLIKAKEILSSLSPDIHTAGAQLGEIIETLQKGAETNDEQ